MFVVYDNLKEESIICFKPDTKRGNYTKKELGDTEKNEELGWRQWVICSLQFEILASTMPESILTSIKDTLSYIIPKDVTEASELDIACPLRVCSFSVVDA